MRECTAGEHQELVGVLLTGNGTVRLEYVLIV